MDLFCHVYPPQACLKAAPPSSAFQEGLTARQRGTPEKSAVCDSMPSSGTTGFAGRRFGRGTLEAFCAGVCACGKQTPSFFKVVFVGARPAGTKRAIR